MHTSNSHWATIFTFKILNCWQNIAIGAGIKMILPPEFAALSLGLSASGSASGDLIYKK